LAQELQLGALTVSTSNDAAEAAAAAEDIEAELTQLHADLEAAQADPESAEQAAADAAAAVDAQLELIDGLEADLHDLQREKVEL